MHVDGITGDQPGVNHGGGVVLGVLSAPCRVLKNRRSQRVIRMGIGPPHPLIDHVIQGAFRFPLHVHANFNKDRDDAGILTNRPVPHGTHARIDENLRHRVFGGGVLFHLPGFVHRLHKIERMVVRDELQRIGDAVDHILLLNDCHKRRDL